MRRDTFMARVEACGATVDHLDGLLVVDAPMGYHWTGRGSHSLSEGLGRRGLTLPEARKALAECMALGLAECAPDCEECEDRMLEAVAGAAASK